MYAECLKDGGALGQQILFVKTSFFLLVTKACLADQKILPSSQCVLTFHYHPMNQDPNPLKHQLLMEILWPSKSNYA